jgi:predicted nucleotidyltransferase
MLDLQAILDAARRAAEAASCPAEVLLFGSYARGDAETGSDLDLMVIEDQIDDKTAEYLKIHRAVGSMGVGVDIVVISREDFERRRQVPGTVPYWAAREGRRVHDARA